MTHPRHVRDSQPGHAQRKEATSGFSLGLNSYRSRDFCPTVMARSKETLADKWANCWMAEKCELRVLCNLYCHTTVCGSEMQSMYQTRRLQFNLCKHWRVKIFLLLSFFFSATRAPSHHAQTKSSSNFIPLHFLFPFFRWKTLLVQRVSRCTV